MFSHFVKTHNPDKITTFSNNRWGDGGVYLKLGFGYAGETPPSYWYVKFPSLVRHHRYGLRKNSKDDATLSEWENRKLAGWNRIWDLGNKRWVWEANSQL